MNGKEQLIEILTQRYKRYDGVFRRNDLDSEPRYQYYSFNEISTLDDADIDRIIQTYQSKTSEPMSINNRLLLLDCVYETIADNKRYQELFDKLIDIYKIELDDKLTKPTTRYDDFNFVETGELHQAPYTTLPEYSLVLADMCTRYINESQKSYTDNSILSSNKVESRISTYEAIKSDFVKVNQQMPEVQEQIVSQAKVMVNSANEERNVNIEKERQQKEIELINLQQEIIKMENERLEIEKRIKTISSETLGSYFSKQVSQRYPEEYQKFQEHRDQVRNYSSNAITISDLKARFTKVSEDLQFYKGVLPVYENYYQRFEEMKKEYHQQRTISSQEQQPISNSEPFVRETPTQNQQQIVSENKTSGLSQPNFNGLSDDVKRKIIEQMQLRGQGDVIISGINNIYQEGNYIIVDAKQSNGRFVGAEFTIDDFNKIINSPIQQADEQQTKNNQESNISQNNFDKDLIMFIEAKNSNLGKVSEILSVTGYPDSTYEVRFEDGTTHQITITQDEKKFIKSHPPVQQPVQEKQSAKIILQVQPVVEHSQQQVSQEESEKILQDQQKQMKDQVINQIMGAMNISGELSFGDINMGERISIMQNIQNKLNAKSMDELQMLLSTYQEQNIREESMHSGMHR